MKYIDIIRLPITLYIKQNTIMEIRWMPDKDIGYLVPGNDWANLVLRDMFFEMSREELILEGWRLV